MYSAVWMLGGLLVEIAGVISMLFTADMSFKYEIISMVLMMGGVVMNFVGLCCKK